MLTRQGYVIDKSQHDQQSLQSIRRTLTVRPPWDPEKAYGPPPKSFKVYLESPTRLYVPRFWAGPKFGWPKLSPPESSRTEFNFEGSLKQELNQPQAVAAAMKAFETGGGLLSVPTGYGKVRGLDRPPVFQRTR